MKKIIFIISFFCSLAPYAWSQVPDSIINIAPSSTAISDSLLTQITANSDSLSIIADSTQKKQKFNIIRWFKADYPNPKKALILSVVPGMGQVYNKKYWKIPIVYGAIGGLIYVVDLNSKQYRRLQTAYLATVDDDPVTISEFAGGRLDDPTTLKNLRNKYDKNKQLSWFGLIAVYLLGGVDAFVDGHLLDFDVSDDLSLKIKPAVNVNLLSSSPTLGFGLNFGF